MKTVLVACSGGGHDSTTELPYILKKAGLDVTLISSRVSRRYVSSFHDHWIKTPHSAHAIVWKIVEIVTKDPARFDWIILGDDSLLYALADVGIAPELKARIGPVGNTALLDIMGSKVEAASLCIENGILMPPSKACHGIEEAESAAKALGFPVMIKIDRSGGGEGVFRCDSLTDIRRRYDRLHDQKLLVEKFIEGDLINVESLTLQSHLVSYNYSRTELFFGTAGVSIRRRIEPCPALCETLKTISKKLNLTGFCNISLMREIESGRHYLIELDLRPNAWIAYARFAGICFSTAIRQFQANSDFEPATFHARSNERTVSIFHREISYFLGERNLKGILYWLCNRNKCWEMMPFYDPRFLFLRSLDIGIQFRKLLSRGFQMLGRALKNTIYGGRINAAEDVL